MNLKDKVIIITGASSGIGRALASHLSKKGANIVAAARNRSALDILADEINKSGGRCLAVATDVSLKTDVETLVQKAVDYFQRVDILINSAGISSAQGELVDNNEEDIRQTMNVNFMGGIYGVGAVVPHMEKVGGGQIVFISSAVGKCGIPRNAVYCASKFAVNGLAESLRGELFRKHIKVLTVLPAGVDTPFFDNNKKGDKQTYKLHSVHKIAKIIIRDMEKEKRESHLTFDSWLLAQLNFFFPSLLDKAIIRAKGVNR